MADDSKIDKAVNFIVSQMGTAGSGKLKLGRVPVTPPTDEDDLLLVEPDTDRWDAIDEPQESDQCGDSDTTCQPNEDRNEQRKPQSLLDVMNRWPGMVRWADEMSEDKPATT